MTEPSRRDEMIGRVLAARYLAGKGRGKLAQEIASAIAARNAELRAALEDAIDTLEAMDMHIDNPLYNRLRTVLESQPKFAA